MTELEAEHIQNSINVLQELLDAHYASLNRIRPQEKGLKLYNANFDIRWRLTGEILHYIEIENTGSIPISMHVYQLHFNHAMIHIIPPVELNEPLENYGAVPIGIAYIHAGGTETSYVGYPCNIHTPIMIQIKDDQHNEILKTIKVE